ncbi:hypothetical protein Pelo_18326 [Pelomyxa schiedti]|nr:hypothetical protein Pelo_18326 [Pelomyxa schiedti]
MSVTEMPAWCPVYLWTSRMLAYSKRRAIEPCGMGCGGWMANGNDDTSGVWEHRTSRGLIPGSEGMYGDNRSCSANNRKWWVHFHGASDRKAIIVNLVNQFPGDDTLGMKLPREDRWKKQGENYQGFLDDMHRAAAFVHLPSELENCDARDFFFSRIDADEAVILIDGPERHMRRIVVFDVLRTFTTKTFTALSTTSFTSQQRIFSSDGIVTKKSNGVRCFVLQVWEDQRKTLVIEEGTGSVTLLGTHCHNGALSHLSDSVFCITGKGVHETWDTNNTTAPLTVESVDPSNKPKQVRAEAGLLFRIVSQELVATLWPGITTTTIPQETPALLRIHFEGWLLGYITGSSSFLL